MKTLKEYAFSIFLFAGFEAVAVTLWLALDDRFYLFNFTYIGTCLALGTALFSRRGSWARQAVQLAVCPRTEFFPEYGRVGESNISDAFQEETGQKKFF